MDWTDAGKWLVLFGLVLVFTGAVIWLAGRFGLPFGRLPGDIAIERGRFSFQFPVASCILASVVLTLLINLILRILSK